MPFEHVTRRHTVHQHLLPAARVQHPVPEPGRGTFRRHAPARTDYRAPLRTDRELRGALPGRAGHRDVRGVQIFYTPPNVSQAKALAPLLALDAGEDKAVKVVTEVQVSGKKLTAAAITATATRLGYTLPPARDRYEDTDADLLDQLHDEAGEKTNTKLTAAADAAERALALYDEALALGAAPADQARADAGLARLAKTGRILVKHVRHGRV